VRRHGFAEDFPANAPQSVSAADRPGTFEDSRQWLRTWLEVGVLNIRISKPCTRVSIMFSPQRDLKYRPTEDREQGVTEPTFCLVFQDVESETWPLFQPLLRRLDAFGEVPLSLLVSPESRPGRSLADDLHFAAEMDRRLIRGDELVMRGYGTNPDASGRKGADGSDAATRGGAAGSRSLSEREARARLRAGLAQFAELDWPVEGFAASGWQLGEGARAALGKSPFRYTADRERLIRLADNWSLHTPVAVGSDLGAPWGDPGTSTTDPATAAGKHLEQTACLRLVVHPRDLQHPHGRDFWVLKLGEMLAERRPSTLSGWLGRSEIRPPLRLVAGQAAPG
jgi:uncharacterized protein